MNKYEMPHQEKSVLERLRQAFAVYQFVDKRVVTLALSDGFCKLFGYDDRAQAYHDMDNDMYKDTHPDDVARIANAAIQFATEGGRYEVVYRTRRGDSSDYIVVHAMGEHVYTEDGTRLAHIWYTDEGVYVEDSANTAFGLTRTLSNALHEQSLVNASRYDYLTGLPTMTYFFELAEARKKAVLRNDGQPMLMYMDFKGMKFFNTNHGFAEGDRMLQSFAKILAGAFGNENCCRIGADHFAVISEESGLEDKLNRIFHEFGGLYEGKTPPVHVGIYPHRIEDVSSSTACDRAKFACSIIKGSYSSCFNYYRAELREDAVLRQYIVENIDRAIREKWIQVYLQPIIRAVNECVCDAEALARWVDPEKGVLSPASFIPALEDAGLIYKLDLYIVDRVVESIKKQQADGIFVVPHSINLSRTDFDACDIVEEIRRRVDEAGISRERITIEITESIIGSDFEFMKAQVERFRQLGFQVWMDDFGSGYSSLDVLQSIRFDLLKFDMSFMRKLDEGENGKVILTELMRLATSLGVDTVCEGVETREQVRFLQEIGCSKLQGFYYSRPVPYEAIKAMQETGTLIPHENTEESEYYESIGRVNLFDLGVVASDEENAFHNVFETIPIAVLEIKDGQAGYIRYNRSYQAFVKRFYAVDIREDPVIHKDRLVESGSSFVSTVKHCCESGSRMIFDEKMPDGSTVHFFLRRVSINPVTGGVAVVIAVLSVAEPDESTTYADIARALATDYYNIYVIDMDTNDYTEYASQVGGEELSIVRHGKEFFESAKRDTLTRIYEEDREPFLALFSKEKVIQDLDRQGVFTTTYRLIDTGTPMYVNMKITRMRGGNRVILGISIIDAHMKQLEEEKRLRQEKITLGRIAALSPDYLVLYTVDPETGHYFQYNPTAGFEDYGLAEQGDDFFGDVIRDAPKAIAPEDMERHLRVLTKENMLREIRQTGSFTHRYRLVMNGKTVPARLKATLVEESDGEKIILGVSNDAEEYKRQLEEAYKQVSRTAVIYTHIAHALARDYTDLYYVNMETDEFIEYHTDDECGVLSEARRGNDFFERCKREVKLYVHPEDEVAFTGAMNRQFLTETLVGNKVFEMLYRRIKEGDPFYVQMKVSRMEDDPRFIVIAVSNVDEQVRQRRMEARIQEERQIYARLHAITGNYIVVYVVDPETERYREFSATDHYAESLKQAKEGNGFFEKVREVALAYNHPEDLNRFLKAFTKENIFAEIERSGMFTLGYRLIMNDRPIHVQMKAAMVEEKEGPRLIVGLNDIDVQVRQAEELEKRLAEARSRINVDGLTGVKNKHAFMEAEAQMNHQIAERRQAPFAILIFAVNNLKEINDNFGQQAGDRRLREACRIICDIFKHSPVFRIGGDEFAVISQGRDYECLDKNLERMSEHNTEAMKTGGIVIACGAARFGNDDCVEKVFERANRDMCENKDVLKGDATPGKA